MNFRRALKLLQRLVLALATTATISIVAPAPNRATPPPQIITATEFKFSKPAILASADCPICNPFVMGKFPDCRQVNCGIKSIKPTKPSVLFSAPNRIFTTPNFPAMAMFSGENESYMFDPIECPTIDRPQRIIFA